MEEDLKEEIYDQARRHKLKQVKERRRALGLPVEEFDELSEEEEHISIQNRDQFLRSQLSQNRQASDGNASSA